MQVSIVIPNYNGEKFVEKCMESLEKQTLSNFEIIVIDNASADGSDTFIEENYPYVTLIRLDKNYGFSTAVNAGIRAAKAPFVILLNNDTEVTETFCEELVKCIRTSKRIFSCSSKMVSFHDREVMDDAGDLYTVIGWGFQRGVGQHIDKYNQQTAVFSACAGAAIYRKAVFEEVGYFDESHFAYLEDIDVGYRARIAGYKNIYCPQAVVYHVGSGTSGSKYNDFKVRLAARNSIYLNYKNMPLLQGIINLPFLLIGYLVKLLFFAKTGFGKTYIKGLAEGIKTVGACKKVKFMWKNLHRYFIIEIELIWNTIVYAADFLRRRLEKR